MIFEFQDVYKSFRSLAVIKSLNLRIEAGQTTYIIGRSGEGKSVSLKMMVGLIRPDRGQIRYRGRDFLKLSVSELARYRQSMGFLFQHSALFDSMNVMDNITFPRREHSRPGVPVNPQDLRAEVEAILAIVGLEGVLHKMPGDLSVGEKKRVALGRALITQPEILFYDEPTTGLDPIYAERIDELIDRTKQTYKQLTTVVVSHDVMAALKYADQVVMLKNGTAYLQDTPANLQASQDPYIQQFLAGHWFGSQGSP